MAPKKILIITYYWPPSGGAGVQRWVKFCKYLPEFGIEPIILTVKNPTYPLIDQTLEKDLPADIKVFHSKSHEPYTIFGRLSGKNDIEVATPSTAFSAESGLLKKLGVWIRANVFLPDARIGWIPDSVSVAKRIIIEEDIQTIVTSGPPNSTHLIGRRLKKWKSNLKWVMDMRDPWSKIFYNEDLPRLNIAQEFDEHLERKSLKSADEVLVVSEHMKTLQKDIYNRNYQVISNGFDHEDFEELPDKVDGDFFTIKHIGSMTELAIPHSFFKALSSLDKNLRESIKIEFFGSYSEKVQNAINENNITELVDFKGYLPHKLAKAEMKTANLLLLVIPNTKDNNLILTGKIFDYIGAGKPILFIGPKNGDAAHIIKKYKLGVCFDYQDVSGIVDLIENVMKGKEIEFEPWGQKIKAHPFSRFNLTEQLSAILLRI